MSSHPKISDSKAVGFRPVTGLFAGHKEQAVGGRIIDFVGNGCRQAPLDCKPLVGSQCSFQGSLLCDVLPLTFTNPYLNVAARNLHNSAHQFARGGCVWLGEQPGHTFRSEISEWPISRNARFLSVATLG
jgi:hypothetical protein